MKPEFEKPAAELNA